MSTAEPLSLTAEQVAALPQHSMVLVTGEGMPEGGYRVIRAGGDGGAASTGYQIADDRDWNLMVNWATATPERHVTLLYMPAEAQ